MRGAIYVITFQLLSYFINSNRLLQDNEAKVQIVGAELEQSQRHLQEAEEKLARLVEEHKQTLLTARSESGVVQESQEFADLKEQYDALCSRLKEVMRELEENDDRFIAQVLNSFYLWANLLI
jgi:uncharacterized protein (UPF0305 family)